MKTITLRLDSYEERRDCAMALVENGYKVRVEVVQSDTSLLRKNRLLKVEIEDKDVN